MADNKQQFSTDGIGRQEEEVRDLFNLLTMKESADMVPSAPKQAPDIKEPAVEQPTVEENEPTSVIEEILPQEESTEEPSETLVEDSAQESSAEPTEQVVDEQESPVSPTPAPFAERRAVAVSDEYDEEDAYLEMPMLILSLDDDYDDDDETDEYDGYGHFVTPNTDEDEFEVDAEPEQRRNPLRTFWNALRANVPLPCDSKGEIIRKSVFWLSIVLVTGALTYLLYNVWWLPSFTKNMYDDVAQDYHPDMIGTIDNGKYPSGMQLSFQALYDRNPETRGWLSYHAAGNKDFLNIEYPIMYSGDNDKYLTIDFNGNKNKNGALFFDMRSQLNSAEDSNSSLIVYGHNMASGQMLAGLNKFIGNVNNARVAPLITMNTLYDNAKYKVFAVVVTDESAEKPYDFNVRRTRFADDDDYLDYIAQLRARSLFDYPVDVQADDELLLLSTCTVPSAVKFKNGRLTVIARKVRPGESTMVDTSSIIKNDDVIMPYAWYTLQKKQPHAFYSGGVVITTTNSTGTTTTGTLDWDDTTVNDGSTTLPSLEQTSTTSSGSNRPSVSATGSTSVGTSVSASSGTTVPSSTPSSAASSSTESTTTTVNEPPADTTESTETTTSTESTTESTDSTTEATTTEATEAQQTPPETE